MPITGLLSRKIAIPVVLALYAKYHVDAPNLKDDDVDEGDVDDDTPPADPSRSEDQDDDDDDDGSSAFEEFVSYARKGWLTLKDEKLFLDFDGELGGPKELQKCTGKHLGQMYNHINAKKGKDKGMYALVAAITGTEYRKLRDLERHHAKAVITLGSLLA